MTKRIGPYNGKFISELTALLNRYSMENASDTPDFILAEYLAGCLTNWNAYTSKREAWYGRTAHHVTEQP